MPAVATRIDLASVVHASTLVAPADWQRVKEPVPVAKTKARRRPMGPIVKAKACQGLMELAGSPTFGARTASGRLAQASEAAPLVERFHWQEENPES